MLQDTSQPGQGDRLPDGRPMSSFPTRIEHYRNGLANKLRLVLKSGQQGPTSQRFSLTGLFTVEKKRQMFSSTDFCCELEYPGIKQSYSLPSKLDTGWVCASEGTVVENAEFDYHRKPVTLKGSVKVI